MSKLSLVQAKEGGSSRSAFTYNLNGCPTSISRSGVADRDGGEAVYVGGKLKRLLFPGGYATPKAMDGGYNYHYYVTDYLGSVRAVVDEDGAVEETSSYYPYGMQMPDETGAIQWKQPYKYGGKERLTAAGVNLYDFGPRSLYSPAAQFTSLDPKCEDYPHLSPYLYCAANPVNFVDNTRMYIKDYSTLLTWGSTGNLAVTYLGSYHLHWEAEMDGNTIIFHIQKTNSSTMQSALRPPVIGYKGWWQNTIGKRINDSFSTGPGSETTQTFYLTERIILD